MEEQAPLVFGNSSSKNRMIEFASGFLRAFHESAASGSDLQQSGEGIEEDFPGATHT